MKIQNYALLLESKSFFNDLVFPRIQEGGQLEENYDAIVSNFKEQNEALKNKNNILEEKVELMTQYQSLARDSEAGEKEQIQLLLEKIRFANSVTIEFLIFFRLLETQRDGLRERIADLEAEQSSGSHSFESLTKQLHEALASNSEKTDECEKLHVEIAERKKETALLQTCMDDFHTQVSHLQAQYEETLQEGQHQKSTVNYFEPENFQCYRYPTKKSRSSS